MSGEAERGTRFARDLRRIRRARGVSMADIHDATKMAYDMIKRFEHDALINHPQFNRVYLRLFVRGYAEHLDMDVEMTLQALELAMKGQYAGSLAKEYLGEPGQEVKKEPPKKEKKTSRRKAAAPASDQVKEAASDPETPDPGTSPAGKPAARKYSATKIPAARGGASPGETSDQGASARASSSGASLSKGAGAKASAGSDSDSGPDVRWIFVGVLVVVVGLVIWGLTRMGSGSDGLAEESSSATELVELANDSADITAPGNNSPLQSLPDTLNITIVADKGSVAPIRITVDSDFRRPYWIDRGDSMTFRMADRIVLEQQLDSVTVQVEGMAYPVSRPNGEDMTTLTRDMIGSWFSSIQP